MTGDSGILTLQKYQKKTLFYHINEGVYHIYRISYKTKPTFDQVNSLLRLRFLLLLLAEAPAAAVVVFALLVPTAVAVVAAVPHDQGQDHDHYR